MLAGLATTATAGSACTPRTAPSGSGEAGNPLNPAGQRLRSALSSNGLDYTRTGLPVLDQAATPSLVLVGGLPYLYYTAYRPDGQFDAASLSIGSADAASWQHCQLQFIGLPAGLHPVDPDVVALPGGGLRMYLTGRPAGGNRIGIHYADSSDGLSWTYGGESFAHSESIIDSISFNLGGVWHQYALEADSISMVYGTGGAAGTSFGFVNTAQRSINLQPQVISQAIALHGDPVGSLRLFSFGPPNAPGIRSFTTSDGATLASDGSLHLAFDASTDGETSFIKDPAVVRLAGGDYLMVYSTAIVRFHSGFEH